QSKAMMFAKVRIKNLRRGAEMEYQLVSESEADLKAKKISVESPIGKGLLGKKVGDKTEVQTPAGTQEFEILGITYDF
ncbi:MAG: GreA/GreB family elongation factor, partial [Bacteroidota bacterium]|nr:GreA/GreB family elongation factor [Bacteroidota bacterium]